GKAAPAAAKAAGVSMRLGAVAVTAEDSWADGRLFAEALCRRLDKGGRRPAGTAEFFAKNCS
ncbi:MAG: hypothetical protein AB7S63_13550, partial [Thauera sp.]